MRGEETILTLNEGTTSEGMTFRTGVATFQGEGGPAMVIIAGPIVEWDLEMVESFIASIQ